MSAEPWTIVPMFLKPDALEGEYTTIGGPIASDFATYLAVAIGGDAKDFAPSVQDSEAGASRARDRVASEMEKYPWFVERVVEPDRCASRLLELSSMWSSEQHVGVPELVHQASLALGFEIAQTRDRTLTVEDYMAFYRYTDEPDMHERMRRYLVGRPTRLLLACGQQQLSVLHTMKIYLRLVVRYPIARPRMQNWIHVTDGDAVNYPELLRMYQHVD